MNRDDAILDQHALVLDHAARAFAQAVADNRLALAEAILRGCLATEHDAGPTR